MLKELTDMTWIKKVVGRAGTGKTTYMVNMLDELIDCGVKPWEIGMVSFSRVAARVFIERVSSKHDFKHRDFKNFGTMHSIASKLIGWDKENEITPNHTNEFVSKNYPELKDAIINFDEDYYRLTPTDKANIKQSSKLDAMKNIDQLMRGLCISDTPDKYSLMHELSGRGMEYKRYVPYEMGNSETDGKIILGWKGVMDKITPSEQDSFSRLYKEFKTENGLMDHTDTLECAYHEHVMFDVKYLFVDEFQDFNRLQFNLYHMWRDNPNIETICIAGDDAQTITRFGGASPKYFISEPCDEQVILPKTYRHGKVIFDDAKIYLDKMSEVIECDVLPSETDGEIIQVYGDEWQQHLKFGNDESVLVLSATSDWVNKTKTTLKELLPDTFFGTLGQKNIEERVLEHYNIIADLERGEEVEWERIKELFTSQKNSLPSKMIIKKNITTLEGTTTEYVTSKVLKNIKSAIRSGKFDNYEIYDKIKFEEHFMNMKWNGRLLLNNIKDIAIFEGAQDKFPVFCDKAVNKHVGTIHKSKGDEADTVILFMSVPYPNEVGACTIDGRDDILHLFYVGKTRPKTKLIEVYGYHLNGASIALAPFDLV